MELRNPRFGNVFSLNTRVLVHELMDQDVQVFQPSDQPVQRGFQVEFEALTDDEMARLVSFFESASGEVITLQDHEGTDWTGMVRNDTIVFTEGRGCQWRTGFQFESEA